MNFKNNKPKSFKGHCAMCAEGRKRNQRALTMQERRLDPVPHPSEAESANSSEYRYFFCLCEDCVDHEFHESEPAAPLTVKLGDLMRAA